MDLFGLAGKQQWGEHNPSHSFFTPSCITKVSERPKSRPELAVQGDTQPPRGEERSPFLRRKGDVQCARAAHEFAQQKDETLFLCLRATSLQGFLKTRRHGKGRLCGAWWIDFWSSFYSDLPKTALILTLRWAVVLGGCAACFHFLLTGCVLPPR